MQNVPKKKWENARLSGRIDKDVRLFKDIFHVPENQDIIFREAVCAGVKLCLVFLEGMSSSIQVGKLGIEALVARPHPQPSEEEKRSVDYWLKEVFRVAQALSEEQVGKIVEQILSGGAAVLIDGVCAAVILDTRGFEKRIISRTNNESVVRGAQEGFVESMRSNLTLMRRYVQSAEMITKFFTVGTKVSTRVAVVYMEGVAEEKLVNEVIARIGKINAPRVLGLGQVEQYIEDCPYSLFPQMLMTERPDRTASCLLDGQVAVFMENSPYALIAPITFFHLLHASDDTFERWQNGSFIRVIRFLGAFLSILLPGVYIAITIYHPHLLPMRLISAIAESRVNVPFTVLTEVLVMELAFELINEASTRIPNQIGSSIGIVGALILGQAAVTASLISPIIIIITALTGLGTFVIPDYATALGAALYRLLIIFAGSLLGLYGVFLAVFVILCQLCGMRSFGVPFFAPIAPNRPHDPDILLRYPLWMQKKLMFFARKDSWMHTCRNGRMKGGKNAV